MIFAGFLLKIIVSIVLGEISRRKSLSVLLKSGHWLLLSLGVSTVNSVGSILVVAWFFVIEARRKFVKKELKFKFKFNLIQSEIVILTFISLSVLISTIPQSLLGSPNMQVSGNGPASQSMAFGCKKTKILK